MTTYVGAIVAFNLSLILLYHRIFPGNRISEHPDSYGGRLLPAHPATSDLPPRRHCAHRHRHRRPRLLRYMQPLWSVMCLVFCYVAHKTILAWSLPRHFDRGPDGLVMLVQPGRGLGQIGMDPLVCVDRLCVCIADV